MERLSKCGFHGEISLDDFEPAEQLGFEAAIDGDPVACDILARGGRYLGAMADAVARELNLADLVFDAVRAGGVFSGAGSVLIDAMKSTVSDVYPESELVQPEFEPVVGALLMGLKLDQIPSVKIYKVLRERLAMLERRHNVKLMAGES